MGTVEYPGDGNASEVASMGHRTGVVALIEGDVAEWLDSLESASKLEASSVTSLAIVNSEDANRLLARTPYELLQSWTLSGAMREMLQKHPELDSLLLILHPVSMPRSLVARAQRWMNDDPRVATVSFLSNAAGTLSFPYRNTPQPYCPPGHDETSLSDVLMTTTPLQPRVPIVLPAGYAVLINARTVSAVDGFRGEFDSDARFSILDFAVRCSRRGFQHYLEPTRFVFSQWSSLLSRPEPADDGHARARINMRDRPVFGAYDETRNSLTSPLAIALDSARAKVEGLRVLIDGSCLGPLEMGTQVQTLALVRALLDRADVQTVTLGLPGGRMPSYGRGLLIHPKLKLAHSDGLRFEGAEPVDVLHRPFQPDSPIPWERWRQLAKRIVVTIQDLIAYRVGSYHKDGESWIEYRRCLGEACRRADGVLSISGDTMAAIREEQLDIPDERLFVVKNGSDHLTLDALEETPRELVRRGLAAAPFLLVLGTSYTHKNRDLAIKVWQRLKQKGHDFALIMAGATVATGTARAEEALARQDGGDGLLVLPDVTSAERTWLLRHATQVLYPTSAEGFGLVPFEAAALGTPTLYVSFGPLKELLDDERVPSAWDVDSLAAHAELLITDAEFAARVTSRILARGSGLTWDATADALTTAYRGVLGRVPRA